jgi:ferredoxin-NADP reductase
VTPHAPRLLWSRLADVAGLAATPLAPSLQARIVSIRYETVDTRTLTLRPGRRWRAHRAGQHVPISVAIRGRFATRTYSIASSPDRADGCLEITVKAVRGGLVSRWLVHDARPGDVMTLGLPRGDFVLPDAVSVRPLFVTAGSGITPVMSMLRTLAVRATLHDVVHVHYAPGPRDVIFGDELRALAAAHPTYRLTIVHTRHASAGDRRFTPAQLEALCPDWREREIWACGPAALLDGVTEHFEAAGLGGRLHVERFHARFLQAPTTPPSPATARARVRLRLTGVDFEADGATPLLHAAERAGVHLAHGCRMGLCHTCDATMVSGRARDLRTGRLIDEPGARIQPCVCAAAGPIELDL